MKFMKTITLILAFTLVLGCAAFASEAVVEELPAVLIDEVHL